MSPRFAGCFLFALVCFAFACGDDDDNELTRGNDAGLNGPKLDEDALASELSARDAQRLCAQLDHYTGLLDDLLQACTAEAYLYTFDADECNQIVDLCTDNGQTVFGLELPVLCAVQPTTLPGCDAKVGDMLDCAMKYGAFWRKRECTMESLAEIGPDCGSALAEQCPVLYGDDTPSGGDAGVDADAAAEPGTDAGL